MTLKHASTQQPGLYFWAEQIPDCQPDAWHVVSQATGYPATEAFDDWFRYRADADDVARALANGSDPSTSTRN